MKRKHIFWLLSLSVFTIFYLIYGGVSVEGQETAPVDFYVLDIVVWLVMQLVFAFVISVLFALFLMRDRRYFARIGELLPIMFFGSNIFLLILRIQVGDSGPVH